VGHLDGLDEKYGPKGFKVVAISSSPRASVDTFVEKFTPKHAIVLVPQSTIDEMGIRSFPSGFLLGPNGRVLWAGHPGELPDSRIEEHLDSVRVFPSPLPAKLKAVEKPLEKGKYGEALTKVNGLLAGTTLTDEERPTAEQVRDWLTWYGTAAVEGAAKDLEAGKVYEAWQAYESVAVSFKGLDLGKQATDASTALMADKDKKREVEAGKRLDKAREQAREENDPEKAAKLFEAVAKKFEGTKAAAKAEELAKELVPTPK
jgi:hypothetical protein